MNCEDKPLIYVCAAYSGTDDYNRILKFGQYVVNQGYIPIIPHTMLHGVLDDGNPQQRADGLEVGRRLLKMCDAVWVFGRERSQSGSVAADVKLAGDYGIPVRYIDVTAVWGADEQTQALIKCVRFYENTYGTVNGAVADEFKRYMAAGVTPDLICECIRLAALKNARWQYSKVILDACVRGGIFTLDAYQQSKAKKKEKPRSFAAYDLDIAEKMIEGTLTDEEIERFLKRGGYK